MEIENTGWQSFVEENKTIGGVVFGYKAPANNKALQGFPTESLLMEVRNSDGSFSRLVNLENKNKEKFAQGQFLVILDSRPLTGTKNENFRAFEMALEKKINKTLPDNRFDQFIDWTNPGVWKKKKNGYSLDISRLSEEKKEALITDFKIYGGTVKDGQLSVTGPKWVKVLEFEWEMAKKQKLLCQKNRYLSR